MAKPRSLPPRPLPPAKRPPPAPAPRAPEAATAPMMTVTPVEAVLAALHEKARLAKRTDMNTVDLRFSTGEMGPWLLIALQDYPKPDKSYHIRLPSESGVPIEFEVAPLDGYVFRITLKTP